MPMSLAQVAGSLNHVQRLILPSATSQLQRSSQTSSTLAADPDLPASRRDFRIALLCALSCEADAVEAIFDKRWDDHGNTYGKALHDQNVYSTGMIGRHNVVLAYLPGMGKEAAARVSINLKASFENIQLALLVGVCGVAPQTVSSEDIYLGDVILSQGIVQHDFGRQYPHNFVQKDEILDVLARPNPQIRAFLTKMMTSRHRKSLQAKATSHLSILQSELGERVKYPGANQDILFPADYTHKHRDELGQACSCGIDKTCESATHSGCNVLDCARRESASRNRLVKTSRDSHSTAKEPNSYEPTVHFGLVASGDTVMKSGEHRDQVVAKHKVIAFEMEGVGVWDTFPCLIVKGACDYADSHKNKNWQNYAAVTAAAYVKALLEYWD